MAQPRSGTDDAVNRGPGKRDTIRVYRDAAGEFRWKRLRPNGRIISDSGEGYTDVRDARHGMRLANGDWADLTQVRLVDHTKGGGDDE